MMNRYQPHNLIKEGIISGAIGATVVAVWFLILDTMQSRPLHTPEILGATLFSLLGPPFSESEGMRILGYTIFHYLVFCAFGTLLVFIVHRSRREPNILAGLLVMFVTFELGFYFFAAMLGEPELLGDLGWYQIAIGNLLSAAAMGVWIFRTHPMLSQDFAHALRGDE